MKHNDIVMNMKNGLVGKVVISDTGVKIESIDDNKWMVQANRLYEFKTDWKVVESKGAQN